MRVASLSVTGVFENPVDWYGRPPGAFGCDQKNPPVPKRRINA
jgi:hypothetical protein